MVGGDGLITYLVIHGVTTLGAMIVFLVRNEHRITKLETSLSYLMKSHDVLTGQGVLGHLREKVKR